MSTSTTKQISNHSSNLFTIKMMKNFFKYSSKITPRLTAKILLSHFYKPAALNKHSKQIGINNGSLERLYKTATKTFVTYTYGKGQKILLIHGWGGSAQNFTSFIDPLVNSGYQVITVDLPGHGKSKDKESSMFDFMAAINKIQEENEIFAIIGHSVGGLCAANICAKSKDIKKIVTISTPTSIYSIVRTYKWKLNISKNVETRLLNNITQKFEVQIPDYSISNIGSQISQSSLCIHDRSDRFISHYELEKIKYFWSSAQIHKTNGLGHYRILHDPSTIDKIIHFFKD